MKNSTHTLREQTTAFQVIEMGDYLIELYWTRAGTYGQQVASIVFKHHGFHGEHRTSGCGFDKIADATESVFATLGVMPANYNPGSEPLPWEYHVGGNYYRVPKKSIRFFRR